MKILIVMSLLLELNSAFARPKIIGGKIDLINNNNGIFQLFIKKEEEIGVEVCTATKVSENFIITAAHCLIGKGITALKLNNGSADTDLRYSELKPEEVFIHPDYQKLSDEDAVSYVSTFTNSDVGLIKVSPSSEFKKLKVIPINFEFFKTYSEVEFWGYGCDTSVNDLTNKRLRKFAQTITLTKEELQIGHGQMTSFYAPYVDSIYDLNIVTAGNRKDAFASSLCPGDSGGPLLFEGKLIGINSNYTFDDLDPETLEGGSGVSRLNLHARLSKVKFWIEAVLKK